MIECKKVSFSYPPNETDIGDREGHGTLRNIDLSINDGDFVLLCGTSGCGKTTLTRLFNGLIPHYYDGKLEGTVMLDGEDMSGLSWTATMALRRLLCSTRRPRKKSWRTSRPSGFMLGSTWV